MVPPRLTVPLILETRERQPDGMGGHSVQWVALGQVFAAMKAGRGAMRGAEAGPESVAGWTITLRGFAAGDPRRPRPGQRLRMGARLFRIESVAEADAAGCYVQVIAEEELA